MNGVGMSATTWVDWRRELCRSASGRRSGWRALVKHNGRDLFGNRVGRTASGRRSGYRLETALWVEPWWSETACVYWLERRRTASVEYKLLAYKKECHGRR